MACEVWLLCPYLPYSICPYQTAFTLILEHTNCVPTRRFLHSLLPQMGIVLSPDIGITSFRSLLNHHLSDWPFLVTILKISASIIFCPLPWHIYLPRIYRYHVSICCLPLPLECELHEDRKLILFTATPAARTMPQAWQAYSQISWKNELLLGAQQEQ